MTNVQLFNFKSNQIRVVEIEGNPWFVAKDVCEVLGLTNPTIAVGPLDSSEKAKSGLGKGAPANVISESGLYKLDEVEKTLVPRKHLGMTPGKPESPLQVSDVRPAPNQIRVVEIEGSPWFVGADVCRVLELDNTSYVVKRLGDDEKASLKLPKQHDHRSPSVGFG